MRRSAAVRVRGYETRQVHDLPPIQIEVTEHRAMQVCCAGCGTVTQAAFPDGVKPGAQYGSGVAALAVYGQVYQMLPLGRTRELSEGTVVNMLAECAERVAPIAAQIKTALTQADRDSAHEDMSASGGVGVADAELQQIRDSEPEARNDNC